MSGSAPGPGSAPRPGPGSAPRPGPGSAPRPGPGSGPAGDAARRARLRVDPVACAGVGICAHVAAELVGVDSWGYPIIRTEPLPDPRSLRAARAAVVACPRRALYLDPAD